MDPIDISSTEHGGQRGQTWEAALPSCQLCSVAHTGELSKPQEDRILKELLLTYVVCPKQHNYGY